MDSNDICKDRVPQKTKMGSTLDVFGLRPSQDIHMELPSWTYRNIPQYHLPGDINLEDGAMSVSGISIE